VGLCAVGSATEAEQEGDEQDRADDPDDHADVGQEEQQNDPDRDENERKGEYGRVVPGIRPSKPAEGPAPS
jgi:hypothetical protein